MDAEKQRAVEERFLVKQGDRVDYNWTLIWQYRYAEAFHRRPADVIANVSADEIAEFVAYRKVEDLLAKQSKPALETKATVVIDNTAELSTKLAKQTRQTQRRG